MRSSARLGVLGGVFVVCGSLGGVGCGGGAGTASYCAEAVECEGGNARDQQACLDLWSFYKSRAATYGCVEQYNAYRQCVVENASCEGTGDSKSYTTIDPDAFEDQCGSEDDNLDDCIDGASNLDDP